MDRSGDVNTFNIPTSAFAASLTVNTVGPFTAIRESLASHTSTFIFVGNIFNNGPFPGFLALGTGKSGAAHIVQSADQVFGAKGDAGPRFYYIDERNEDGSPMFTGLGGQVHADCFLGLAERKEGWKGLPWLVTPVKGVGYKEFPRKFILAGQ